MESGKNWYLLRTKTGKGHTMGREVRSVLSTVIVVSIEGQGPVSAKGDVRIQHSFPLLIQRSGCRTICAIVILLLLTSPGLSLAYIDPQAGGFLMQLLAPLGAVVVSGLIYFRRQLGRLIKRRPPPADQPEESN